MAYTNRYAHTKALLASVDGKRPSSAADAKRFITEIDALLEFCPNIPESMREETIAEFRRARKFYEEMTSEPD